MYFEWLYSQKCLNKWINYLIKDFYNLLNNILIPDDKTSVHRIKMYERFFILTLIWQMPTKRKTTKKLVTKKKHITVNIFYNSWRTTQYPILIRIDSQILVHWNYLSGLTQNLLEKLLKRSDNVGILRGN